MDVRHNNFDLLRILAALQVVVVHGTEHLRLTPGIVVNALGIFPGVPIFFVISGFLVSASYERSDLRTYAINRALRIYPALWGCLIVSIAIAAINGVSFDTPELWPWLAAQASIAQFYNPDFLRDFGVGVLNGSLWTIPVELQFYAVLPLLCMLSRRALVVALVLFVVANQVFVMAHSDAFAMKLAGVTVLPWLYMFLIGVILQRNPAFVRRFLAGRLPVWLSLYVAAAWTFDLAGLNTGGNYLNPLSVLLLGLAVISAAYARPVRMPYDLSYGLYLYHMVVINVFVSMGAVGSYVALIAAIAVSAGLAFLSWTLIERPALKLKHRAPAIAGTSQRPVAG